MPRKPPHWKPHRTGTIENLFGNIPSTDTVFIPIINETQTKTIYVFMKSDEAKEFAEKILQTIEQVKRVQKIRGERK